MNDDEIEELIREQLENRSIPYSSVSVNYSELYIRCPEGARADRIASIVMKLLDPKSLKRIKITYEKNGEVDHQVIEDWND